MAFTYSPLRYPGGKAKLTDFFKNLVEKNNLQGYRYVEPFAGGANVALSLLIDGYVKDIIINDFDKSIYAFWISILQDTPTFLRRIQNIPLTMEEWYKQNNIIANSDRYSLFDIGFAAFYLNRTNFSGVATAGPLGGYNQTGKYKIDARFNRSDLINRISLISSYRNHIFVKNMDALALIKSLKAENKIIIYFDPPYFIQGKKLYTNFYKENDHIILSKNIKKLKVPWVLTYDNVDYIKTLYSEIETYNISINYSAKTHTKGKELMFLNNLPSTDRSFIRLAK